MSLRRSPPPAESDLLCEFCGYILNGLQDSASTAVCPECGQPLAQSIDPGHRSPAPVEQRDGGFWRTTWSVIFRKRKFFRETLSRPTSAGVNESRVTRFGRTHRAIAGASFGIAAGIHTAYLADSWFFVRAPRWSIADFAILGGVTAIFILITIALVSQLTRLAVWMAAKESFWWGMRLPKPVIRRAMDFHSANYLPVAVLALTITGGYRLMLELHVLTLADAIGYLLTLSAAVVVGALWLFESFVVAMRRIRYANY